MGGIDNAVTPASRSAGTAANGEHAVSAAGPSARAAVAGSRPASTIGIIPAQLRMPRPPWVYLARSYLAHGSG
ncbi:hypothetical protein G6F24_017723 [Rhizopus arrhizus]|nr:hypothetical protein G6F24_017723 [Rhizopus arrhizus]